VSVNDIQLPDTADPTSWKDAAENVNMLKHIGAIYKDCKIEKADLEAEGLGLRPLTAAENMGRSERNILARRYYRLGQWTEALQGKYWLTVS
jgi:hypothetical protein